MSGVWKMLMVFAAAYAASLVLVFLLQPRLVYFPMQGRYSTTPQARGLAFERLTLPTDDGEQLAAWWIPALASVPAHGTVLLFHGNAGTIEHRIDYAAMFAAMGYHTLLVDYRHDCLVLRAESRCARSRSAAVRRQDLAGMDHG